MAGTVVQVRVSLTWGTAEQDVDLTDAPFDLTLHLRRGCAGPAIEEDCDINNLGVCVWKIRLVGIDHCSVKVDSKAHLNGASGAARGLSEAYAHAPAPSEEVDDPNQGALGLAGAPLASQERLI